MGNVGIVSMRMSVTKMSEGYKTIKGKQLCCYNNCFRPYFKHRGFMPCCKFHYEHPQKWGKDGLTYTGSVWKKKKECVICQKETTIDFDGYCQSCHDETAERNVREGTK